MKAQRGLMFAAIVTAVAVAQTAAKADG